MKNLIFVLFAMVLFNACSKSATDITPNLIGSWNFKSESGSATIAGKNTILPDANYSFYLGDLLVFKSDGTGTLDGSAVTFTVSGNTISFKDTKSALTYSVTAAVSGNTLTLTSNETGFKVLLDAANKYDPTNAITKLNDVMIYTK